MSFFHYASHTSIVVLPLSNMDCPFIFSETTSDFQARSIQGQATFRIVDQVKVASLLNFTVKVSGGVVKYASEDPQKLGQRVGTIIQVLTKKHAEDKGQLVI